MKLTSLLLLAFVAASSACSFDKNGSIDTSNETQIREKLIKAYDSVAGTYQGTLQAENAAGGEPQIIRIRLFRTENPDDSNSNGASRKIPVLIGNYTKISPIGPGYEFDARYYESTNELILTNVAKELSKDDVQTVTGKIIGNRIIGKIITKGGYKGNINLPLVTRESGGNGGTTEDTEYYDNLRKQFEELSGEYDLKVLRKDGTTYTEATFKLFVENNKSPTDDELMIPSLVGKMHYLNEEMGKDESGNPIGMSDTNFTAVYNTKAWPRRLALSGTPVYGGKDNPFRVTLDGELESDPKGKILFYGTYTQKPAGFIGQFYCSKKETPKPKVP